MIKKKSSFISIGLLFILLFIFSCDKYDIFNSRIIYSNSFEKNRDTIGWKGNCFVGFVDEAAPLCGNKSISVSCGCFLPATNFEIGPFDKEYDVVISFFGKATGNGGEVILESSIEKTITVRIEDKGSKWKFYQSQDTLHCPKNEKLVFILFAGGIIDGSIQIDMLQVKAVE